VWAAWAALLLWTLSLAGCGKASAGPRPVRVGYFANATHAQAVLGVASGDFARALGARKLEAKVFNAGPSLIEALFAGEIDVGYVGPGPILNGDYASHGEGIRVIAGAAANGVVIVARGDSDVRSLEDLAGKRIATPQMGNTQDISARHFVQATLKGDEAKSVVPIENAQQGAMLARGEIDAAWVPEPWGQRLIAENGARLIAEEKDLWPGHEFALTLVVTTPEFLAREPEAVEALLRVHHAWTERLAREPQAHAAELGDALFALTGKRLAAGVLPAALARVTFEDEPLEDTLRAFSTFKRDLGFGHASVDTQRLVDTSILHRLAPLAGQAR
jgi:NitT/TauT family transport system substrate-binding protein